MLSQYKGKVVLVNFWATWCDPCYVEIPWLIEMQEKYEAKGFTVLGISMTMKAKAPSLPSSPRNASTSTARNSP